MLIKKSQLAKLCGVKPPSISGLIEKGSIHVSDGRIDLDDPLNLAYLTKHNAAASAEYQRTGTISGFDAQTKQPDTTPKPPSRQRMTKKLDEIRAEEPPNDESFNPMEGLTITGGVKRRGAESSDGGPNLDGLTDAEVAETLRKPLYDAQKAKNDAALKALELDKRNGTLIELEVVMEYMTQLSTAIQTGFLDVIPKQALMICSRLGTVGRESEVEDLLADDNSRRIERVKGIVEKMATAKWGIMNRHVIKDDDADSEAEE